MTARRATLRCHQRQDPPHLLVMVRRPRKHHHLPKAHRSKLKPQSRHLLSKPRDHQFQTRQMPHTATSSRRWVDPGLTPFWVQEAGVSTCTSRRTWLPLPSTTWLPTSTRSPWWPRRFHRNLCHPGLPDVLTEAALLGSQAMCSTSPVPISATADCSVEPSAPKQLFECRGLPSPFYISAAWREIYSHDSHDHICSGRVLITPWCLHASPHVQDSAADISTHTACTRQCWHVSSLLAYFLGSIPQPSPQLCLPCLYVPLYRQYMARGSDTPVPSTAHDDEEYILYHSLEWKTWTPPPLTVYLLPYLRGLLSRRGQATSPSSDHGGGSRESSANVRPRNRYGPAEDRKAPCTPPGATSSRDLAAQGRLPSRLRDPVHPSMLEIIPLLRKTPGVVPPANPAIAVVPLSETLTDDFPFHAVAREIMKRQQQQKRLHHQRPRLRPKARTACGIYAPNLKGIRYRRLARMIGPQPGLLRLSVLGQKAVCESSWIRANQASLLQHRTPRVPCRMQRALQISSHTLQLWSLLLALLFPAHLEPL